MSRFNSKSSTELKILKIRQFDISRNTQRTTHVIDLIQRVDCNLHMTKQLSMSQIRVYDVVVTCAVFEIFERFSLEEFSREAHFRDPAQIYEIDDSTEKRIRSRLILHTAKIPIPTMNLNAAFYYAKQMRNKDRQSWHFAVLCARKWRLAWLSGLLKSTYLPAPHQAPQAGRRRGSSDYAGCSAASSNTCELYGSPQSLLLSVSALPLFAQWIVPSLTSTARYCQFTKKDPVATLKGISINVLYAFFDWLRRERKDRLGAASFELSSSGVEITKVVKKSFKRDKKR